MEIGGNVDAIYAGVKKCFAELASPVGSENQKIVGVLAERRLVCAVLHMENLEERRRPSLGYGLALFLDVTIPTIRATPDMEVLGFP